MNEKTTTWQKLIFLFMLQFLSTQAFANDNCTTACEVELNNCQKAAVSQKQKNRCSEESSVCALNCNRDKTMYCTYLGFKDYDGKLYREKELAEATGGYARVTSDGRPHFGGLCSSFNLKCDHVIDWNKKIYYCGGELKEPGRVGCCR